ncbi:hypothetical protein Tco_1278367, partial [Tanacetum coccineum]
MEVSSSPSISSLPLKKPKETAWEQFSSNIATARKLLYSLHQVTEPSTSPLRITSSPSPSPEPSPSPSPEPSPSHSPAPSFEHSPDHTTAAPTQPSPTQPSPTQPSPTQPSTGAEHHFPIPHDSPLHVVHSHGSDEGSLKLSKLTNLVTKLSDKIEVLEDDLKKTKKTYSSAFTKLILKVKKLESQIKIGKARKRAKVVLSEDYEDVEDDSSKHGRKLSDAKVQEKASIETEPFIQEVTPTEVIQDQGSSEKGSAEVSTAGAKQGTASEVLIVSTTEENLKPEPKKNSKKEIEQERLSFAEAIRLEEQMNKEQRAQITRDEEIVRKWDKKERQRAMSEAKSTKKIDWNDPSVIRYHALKMKPKTIAQARRNMIKYLKNQGNYKISDFKGMSYNEIRPIFEKVWDFNQHIEPIEHGSEKMKSPEKIDEKDVDTQKEVKEVAKESRAKRKKSLPRKRRTVKRQKLEEDAEKEELKGGDGSSKNYKVLSEMLEDLDKQDEEEFHTYADREEISSKSIDDFQDVEKEIGDKVAKRKVKNRSRRGINKYEDDETEDGPVDYPIDGGDDDDGDSSGDDADDEDEEEEDHLALTDSTIVVPTDEPVSPPEGTEPAIPPLSTDITIEARITVRPQVSISLPPKAEVERLLAMTTPSPSPPISLSPPFVGERLARCTAPPAHLSPLLPSSGCPTQIQILRIASTQALIDAVTAALPLPPLPPLPPSLYIPPPVDRRDDIPESKQPPRKSTVDAEERRQGIRDVRYGIRDTWVDPTEAVPKIAPMTVGEVNTRVIELAELHEHDTQDLYALIKDAQDS